MSNVQWTRPTYLHRFSWFILFDTFVVITSQQTPCIGWILRHGHLIRHDIEKKMMRIADGLVKDSEGGRYVIVWTRFPPFSIHPLSIDSRCPSTDTVPAGIPRSRRRSMNLYLFATSARKIYFVVVVSFMFSVNSNLTASAPNVDVSSIWWKDCGSRRTR